MASLNVKINNLSLKNPVMTASGTFGYGVEFADFVLNALGFKPVLNFNFDIQGNPVWGVAEDSNNSRVMLNRTPLYRYNQIPNVVGMGARDAVYLVESRGVKVKMEGRGKVVEQSLEPGRIIKKGDVMRLKLE